MSDGNPHLACGIAENGHYVVTCASCRLPLIEHSIDELNQTIAAHLAVCSMNKDANTWRPQQ